MAFYFSKVIYKVIVISLKVTINCSVKLQWRHTTRLLCLLSFCLHSLHCMLVHVNARLLWPIGKAAPPPLSIAWSSGLYCGQTWFHLRKYMRSIKYTLVSSSLVFGTETKKNAFDIKFSKKHRIQMQVDYHSFNWLCETKNKLESEACQRQVHIS